MAHNGRGALRPAHHSRSPPFIVIGLLVVIGILGFNYWTASSKNSLLSSELQDIKLQLKNTRTSHLSLEKRNTELLDDVRVKTDTIEGHEAHLKQSRNELDKVNSDLQHINTEADELRDSIRSLHVELDDAKRSLSECDAELVSWLISNQCPGINIGRINVDGRPVSCKPSSLTLFHGHRARLLRS